MALTSELQGLRVDFENFAITKDNTFLNVSGNRVVFSDKQETKWVFEKQENDDMYAIRNINAGKDHPKYIGSANTNNILLPKNFYYAGLTISYICSA